MASKSTTVALITGANQGIGLAVATSLAKNHGYHVIIGSRRLETGQAEADKLTVAGYAASAVQLDVTSDASINAAVATIAITFGRLDVLVNNAGVLLDSGAAFAKREELPVREMFEQTFQTNVFGVAVLTEALLPLLRRAMPPGPRLVFVSSSMASLQLSTDKETAWYKFDYKSYDASKAAVNILMLNYARILSDDGGMVNSACPGLVSTSMTSNTPYGHSADVGAQRIVELATLGAGGPTATFSNKDGPVPW
ncbi:short chain dehydrogenase reductase [Grosmannia clavigera kw1407]|uniref:Short chain dehydrogenase reductase n=1 Tax=Grosmannia clavigera (strain kw1407 / UAMH 11150) TaxID=655863 RepID=F0XJW6_GROCL|nr:short chain dehydrogenase reductase [Grosmannia clavigera kw1407]EFX02255.1 short chain dehydrogenase reductase [Grosmannia clavigera kw1407]